MAEDLTIYRNDHAGNVLRVTATDTGFNLTTTGGGNISQAEYDQIAAYVDAQPGAEPFLAKLQARMAR